MGLDGQSGAYAKGSSVSGIIYVDKCSIEAYVDESKTVSGSKFFKGTGLEVFIDGDAKCSVTVKEMKSIRNLSDEDPAGEDPIGEDPIGEDPIEQDPITNYVKRLYTEFLGRKPDVAGLDSWVDLLKDGSTDLMHVIKGFVLSLEFEAKGLDDEGYVTALYNVIFNREPDESGLEAWLKVLDNGGTRKLVLAGFINSKEMEQLASELNVAAGRYQSDDLLDRNYGVTSFVSRLYLVCLGRKYDEPGLRSWVSVMLNGISPSLVVRNFLISREMNRRNLGNEEFLTTCYRAIFNREPDAGGMANWLALLERTNDRLVIVNGFTSSLEFEQLCNGFGIAR
ncbi:MAG: DUF4214 domain-containing protein [Lachnospiraceae bacterium]|nr:DUF4214 domain-containing protein [Lachnospiraceae bacterium]